MPRAITSKPHCAATARRRSERTTVGLRSRRCRLHGADNLKQRVCLIHNNLSLDHFMKNEKEYLISWDNYMVDSPIIDLYKFYQKEWEKVDFASLLAAYNEEFALLDEEKMLLDIIISIPSEVKIVDDEMENCRNYRKLISYLYKTSYLVQT